MSMSVEDFEHSFIESELKEIKLTTWKGKGDGILFLRSLPYSIVSRFRNIRRRIQQAHALNIMAKKEDVTAWDYDLERAEDYLLKHAVCNESGQLLFEDDKVFKNWRKMITPEIADEIILHIRMMNELEGDFESRESIIESYKKK
jgi:hypothetical protein